jgi:hypothetical protein
MRRHVAAGIVEDDDAAGFELGDEELPDRGAKLSLLMGPSVTQGARMPSWLRPAMKVSLLPCWCGTLASSSRPLSPRECRSCWSRVHLSSMKTRRLTSAGSVVSRSWWKLEGGVISG